MSDAGSVHKTNSDKDENKNTRKSTPVTSAEQQKVYSTPEEYFRALEKWLQEAYMWQSVTASFPYYLACSQYMNQASGTSNNNTSQNQPGFTFPGQPTRTQPQNTRQTPAPAQAVPANGIECKIPAIWKRLAAEFLDFLILFVLKLAVTFMAIDFFEIIDLEKFDVDYKVALQMTHNIIIVEIGYRVVVCLFETFWLQGGGGGRVGGATPGKTVMGLRVVRCENVSVLGDNDETVIIQPGTNLGLGWAFARSFIKNLVLAVFIPGSYAFLYFRFNRAAYDMICNTIVVEEPITHHRPHQN